MMMCGAKVQLTWSCGHTASPWNGLRCTADAVLRLASLRHATGHVGWLAGGRKVGEKRRRMTGVILAERKHFVMIGATCS